MGNRYISLVVHSTFTVLGPNYVRPYFGKGYEICALVSRFLILGNSLNPTSGFSLKVLTQSSSKNSSL